MNRNTKIALGVGIVVIIAAGAYFGLSKNQRTAVSQFTLTAPEADAAGVPSNARFELKSTEDLSASVINTYLHTNPKVAIAVDKKGTGQYTITPKDKLPENKIFAVQIEKGPISAKTYGWAFQVKAPFQVIAKIPTDKGTNVPLNTSIEITFNRQQIATPESFISITPAVAGKFLVKDEVVAFLPDTNALKPKTI